MPYCITKIQDLMFFNNIFNIPIQYIRQKHDFYHINDYYKYLTLYFIFIYKYIFYLIYFIKNINLFIIYFETIISFAG